MHQRVSAFLASQASVQSSLIVLLQMILVFTVRLPTQRLTTLSLLIPKKQIPASTLPTPHLWSNMGPILELRSLLCLSISRRKRTGARRLALCRVILDLPDPASLSSRGQLIKVFQGDAGPLIPRYPETSASRGDVGCHASTERIHPSHEKVQAPRGEK